MQVCIDADLGIVCVIEAAAFLTHDASLGIGKTDLLFVFDVPAWTPLFFALLKGLFGRFDLSQSALFVLQVFGDFIAGSLLVDTLFNFKLNFANFYYPVHSGIA